MIRIPFAAASFGYKQSPSNPLLLEHPDGHPYYPVLIEDDKIYTPGEFTRMMLDSALKSQSVIQKEQVLLKLSNLRRQIEQCGASPELTRCQDLAQELENLLHDVL